MIIFEHDTYGHRKAARYNATKELAAEVVATSEYDVILKNSLLGPMLYNGSKESRVKGTQQKQWEQFEKR